MGYLLPSQLSFCTGNYWKDGCEAEATHLWIIRDHVIFYGCQTLGFYLGGKGILRENHNDPRKLNDSALICAFIMFNLSVSFERTDHGTLKTFEIFG